MKLLDIATKVSGRVDMYDEIPTRECGVEIRLTDACDTGSASDVELIGTAASAPGTFKTAAFPLEGILRRGSYCSEPDDLSWFARAFTAKLEFILTWMLTIEHSAGSETWTNGAGVQTVALGATPSVDQRVAAIMAARLQWESTIVADSGPILHVPPSQAPALVAAGLIVPDGSVTVSGDPVVVGAGYDKHPQVFWSGPITIALGPLNQQSVPRSRLNEVVNALDQWARFEFAPCAVVRVGSYA